ncbi:MAG TPA: SOS response-associated peptidase [Lentimicrobium sp.]|nr:SOS response-associated peptidase [Lentimicrobium sp.]
MKIYFQSKLTHYSAIYEAEVLIIANFSEKKKIMCGRFSLTTEEQQLNKFFKLSGGTEPYVPRYNGAPTQQMAIIAAEEVLRLQYFRWGLIPSWTKEIPRSTPVINARAETLSEKASFRQALKSRRCLVPADGFYEWTHSGKKQPYRFVMDDESPFAMAGIWEYWKGKGSELIRSFAIITTTPNELMEPVHNRMPVILKPENYEEWLFSHQLANVQSLLVPYPSKKMKKYKVSDLVNSVKSEGPLLIKPAEQPDLFGDADSD